MWMNLPILFKRTLKEEIEILLYLTQFKPDWFKEVFIIPYLIPCLPVRSISASMVVVFPLGETTHHTKIPVFPS